MSAIGFKSIRVLRGMFTVAWHPLLIALFLWLCVRYSKDKICLTSAHRKKKIHPGDTGMHMTDPLRAIDLRSHGFAEPEKVEKDINTHWVYDPERPQKQCCKYHDTGKGFHFHVQVHPNTKYIANPNKE